MAKLTFVGGAGTVTGSKYLLTDGDRRILIDGGVFQGEKRLRELNWKPFPVSPASLEQILVTHAHTDHVGYLPVLVRDGFAGKILATPATCELTAIVLRDAAYLAERDAQHAAKVGYSRHQPPRPLFTIGDAERTLTRLTPVEYGETVELGQGWSATWSRAGHILGSASIRLQLGERSILFSGDLGRPAHPVLRPREVPPGAETALIESTYGAREHFEPTGAEHEPLADLIRRTARRGGSVLIPAFAVDRTEVVLQCLTELFRAGRIPEMPVYVNSPMALAALAVYRDRRFTTELRPDLDPAGFVQLPRLHEVRSTQESIQLNDPVMPSIIISSSGMATGGRVLHHLARLLPDPRNAVVLAGYQAEGTRGRALLDGAAQLKIHGRQVAARAEVLQDEEFSVHADRSELLEWLGALTPAPRRVFTVHGSAASAQSLAEAIGQRLGISAAAAQLGGTRDLTKV